MGKAMRSIDVVNQLYNNKCAELGHAHFTLTRLPSQIEELERQVRSLKNEADQIQAYNLKEQQDKAKVEADRVLSKRPKQVIDQVEAQQ